MTFLIAAPSKWMESAADWLETRCWQLSKRPLCRLQGGPKKVDTHSVSRVSAFLDYPVYDRLINDRLRPRSCCKEQLLFTVTKMVATAYAFFECNIRQQKTRKSSWDEIANVNFLHDDIVHALQNTIHWCINSATALTWLWLIIAQIFASEMGVLHFNALAGVIPCRYRHRWYIA